LLTAEEDLARGGRFDDARRVRDLQRAIDDENCAAIVAASGGGFFARILPNVDFSGLSRRKGRLWAFGFSEMTSLVNVVGSYRSGRGVYWLCPNYVGWKVEPQDERLAAFEQFWAGLAAWLAPSRRVAGDPDGAARDLVAATRPIEGRLVRGRTTGGTVRLVGGCLSVLAALLTGPQGRRIRSDGRWLFIEDVNEACHRIDRHLAALKMAGWFGRVAGVIVGDFHTRGADQRDETVALLRFHLPSAATPVVVSTSFGHTWPIVPVPVNQRLRMTVSGRAVTIERVATGRVVRR